MVQLRQLYADHPDSHYCAAIFKYLKEFVITFREHTTLVCLDDKHNIKVGEPGFSVAAVDRGKQVPYSGKLSREKTFMKFAIFSQLQKFSP